MKKTPNWTTLPSDIIQEILNNLDVCDVQCFTEACKKFYVEGDYFLKDKIWLCIDKIDSLKSVKLCKRRFEHLKANKISATDIRIVKALMKRDIKFGNRITTAFIRFDNLNRLISVIDEFGENLKTLTLHNQTSNMNKRKRSLKSEDNPETITSKNLDKVEHLKMDSVNNNIIPISTSFKNLRNLELFSVTSDRVVENLVMSNPFLERLSMKYITHFKKDSLMFENMRSLKSFFTHDELFARAITKQNLPLESLDISCVLSDEICLNIRENFGNLRNLTIRASESSSISERGLSNIWRIRELKSFKFKGQFSSDVWLQSFKTKNISMNFLSLQGKGLAEEIILSCIKNLPNVQHFDAFDIMAPSFRFIQEIAENWKNLNSLGLSLVDEMSFGRLLKYKPWKTPPFAKLENLRLRSNFEAPTHNFFKYFKAPNLKELTFDLSAVADSEENAILNNLRKLTKLIYRNSPDVEIFLDTEQLHNEMSRMRDLIFHARTL